MFELLLAYALFIIVLAIPYVLIAGIVVAFVVGGVATIAGIRNRRITLGWLGVLLMLASGITAITVKNWATYPPTSTSSSAHRVVYNIYLEMRARKHAMKWLRDGTFSPPSKGQSPSGNVLPR
jgi:hypothetical protein